MKAAVDSIECAVPIVQLTWSRREQSTLPEPGSAGSFTFGAIGRALPRLVRVLEDDPATSNERAAALAISREWLAARLLAQAIDKHENGITLLNTHSSEYLAAAAKHATDVNLTTIFFTLAKLLEGLRSRR